jgi:hypothetical protein
MRGHEKTKLAIAKRSNEKEHNMKTMQDAGRGLASKKSQICIQ